MSVCISKSLLTSVIAMCVIALSPRDSQASHTPDLFPVKTVDPVATSTTVLAAAPSPFMWSNRTLTVGSTLKVSKLVTTKVKGTRVYRASGFCSLRKGVLSFEYTGKCRVTVTMQPKTGAKVLRSTKVFLVGAKTSGANWTTSGMPDPIGCTPAAKHPVSGTPYPDTEPGWYEFQTGWTCTWDTMDARPLIEYFKSKGWVKRSTISGTASASLYKGSNRVTYGPHFDRMPEGQAFLMLTIYANGE